MTGPTVIETPPRYGCPRCNRTFDSMEDYERLFESLTPEEQVQLASAVRDLSTPVPFDMVDSTAMEVAKANGLSLMDESQLELMTVSQAAYWSERLARESRKAEELARSLVGRKG